MQSHDYFTWNTIIAFASIRRESSQPISHNGHHSDRVLSAGCKSFLVVFPSYLLPRSIAQSGTVIINTDPHTESVLAGLPFISKIAPTHPTISTCTECHRLFPPYITSGQVISLSGITALYNCKDLPVLSASNIAFFSPSKWTEVTL
jgi:hypothetical protein